MKNSTTRSISRAHASRFAIALACASSAAACSGYYPLGSVSQEEQPLEGGEPGPSTQSGDAQVGTLLAAPEVTISSPEVYTATLVAAGDMDGDGHADMAYTSDDPATGAFFVHIRYGGPRPLGEQAAFAFDRSGAFLTMQEFLPLYVFAAGDVDGDGRSDLIVKTVECEVTRSGEGAYLVYGGERMTGAVSLSSVGAHFAPPSRAGDHLNEDGCHGPSYAAGPGDMDGDGIDDFVLDHDPGLSPDGSPTFGSGEGVYVFYGRAERLSGDLQYSDADTTFHIAKEVESSAVGDVNGDGLADLLVAPVEYDWPPSQPGSYMLAGRAQRYSGALDLVESTRLIAEATPGWTNGPGDLDGDGIDDLVLEDAERIQHLFYGSPAAFEAGFDFAQADAVLPQSELSQAYLVGDRDADGDDELLDFFGVPNGTSTPATDVAFLSGGGERLSGDVLFPESEVIAQTPNGRFPGDPYRLLDTAMPAGDLDGDGAADLFTVSKQVIRDGEGSLLLIEGFQLHIHYGTPADFVRAPR
jgi:hypothetical protein